MPESGLTPAEQNVALAAKPPEAVPGALAGAGLMAQVIVSKGADHLPLHRLEGIFQRQGMRISRQTMDGWWLQTAEFLQPLYALAIPVVLASPVLHTDDTSVRVRDAHQKRKYTGRFWPYIGNPLHALTVFDYTTNHSRDGPAAFLANYGGYLQADAFNGYDGIYLESQGRIVEVACWSHARRKFHECRRLDSARMETALAFIGKLYAVEKDLRERGREEWQPPTLAERTARIAAERQQRSRPLLNDFHAWLIGQTPKVLPKSPVRGAMDYTLGNWAALCVYTADGWLDIDNNEGENAIRGLCLGRKNWLFLGSDRGGRARRCISVSWPPANVTATIRGSTTATSSPGCPPCSPQPTRRTFLPCCPTAGVRPDLSAAALLPRRPCPAIRLYYVFRRTLTKRVTRTLPSARNINRSSYSAFPSGRGEYAVFGRRPLGSGSPEFAPSAPCI